MTVSTVWSLAKWVTKRSAVIAGLLLAWEVVADAFERGVSVVPAPSAVVASIAAHSHLLGSDASVTLFEAAVGAFAAFAFSLTLAFVFVRARVLEEGLYSVALMVNSLPLIAILPVVVTWFGNGYAPKIVLAALTSFFPMLVNTTRGLKSVDPQILGLMRLLNASPMQTLLKVRWYFALPYILAGLRIGAPSAILGAILGEWISTENGLGYRLLSALINFDPPLLWASMTVIGAASLLAFALFDALERLLVGGWARSTQMETEATQW